MHAIHVVDHRPVSILLHLCRSAPVNGREGSRVCMTDGVALFSYRQRHPFDDGSGPIEHINLRLPERLKHGRKARNPPAPATTFVIVGAFTCSIRASSVSRIGPANTRTDSADSRAGPTPLCTSSFRTPRRR